MAGAGQQYMSEAFSPKCHAFWDWHFPLLRCHWTAVVFWRVGFSVAMATGPESGGLEARPAFLFRTCIPLNDVPLVTVAQGHITSSTLKPP